MVHASSSAILVVGHGTRDEGGLAELACLVAGVADRYPDRVVRTAFLELVAPDISTGVDELATLGARDICVAPLLLFAAGHAKQDLPVAVEACIRRFPHITFSVTEPVGNYAQTLELAGEHLRQACERANVAPSQATLVVVGRGSRDQQALDELRTIAARLAEQFQFSRHVVGFVAVAQPKLAALLEDLTINPQGPVVVLPYLLFQGDVLREVREHVEARALRCPSTPWVLAEHLGSAPLLVDAVFAAIQGRRPYSRRSPLPP